MGFSKGTKKRRRAVLKIIHKLSNIDEVNLTATCSICGAVKLSPRNRNKKNNSKWRCYTKYEERTIKVQANRLGLTVEQYENARNSREHCEICGNKKSDKILAVDHNHLTGKFRGILCSSCNLGIGCFKDDISLLEKAINYLKEKGEN